MMHSCSIYSGAMLELLAEAEEAVGRIPPAFPLAATVAVNPFLGQTGEDRATAAARLERVAGERLFRDRAEIAADIEAGRIGDEALAAAGAGAGFSASDLRKAAAEPAPAPAAHRTVAELAAAASGIDWPGFVAERVGLWASAHFDEGQALWPAPEGDAFESWRAFGAHDVSAEIAGLPGFARRVAGLPVSARAALGIACETLEIGPDEAPVYFHRLLMTLGGWSQLARGRGFVAERDGVPRDETALGLLSVRLVWELALLERYRDAIGADWASERAAYAAPVEPARHHLIDAALQDAADRAAEMRLAIRLAGDKQAAATEKGDVRPALQAAFCIDVRSEVFRRALEASDPDVETIGFAGFFGVAVGHRADASDVVEARAPVLLSPGMDSTGGAVPDADMQTRLRHRATRAWGRFRQAAVSAFAFVEAAGPFYAAKLLHDTRARAVPAARAPAPKLDLALEERIGLAGKVLKAMSLNGPLARVVLVAGHGARVSNAPHASALQCGACGGHAGDVNARLIAGLLNEPEVRAGLAEAGQALPDDTVFVAGLHDTVSDVVTLYDEDIPASHAGDVARLERALAAAGAIARGERAATLPRAADAEGLPVRGGDWAEQRPEWGLAGCAAFIAAPRHRSRRAVLDGRAFLHCYDWEADEGFGVLELILTAPVVVASWIALQYHGSVVAPRSFGAGNKLLHNVTGGVGVVEGNGGLLRAGLPWQSVHDGEAARHETVRLSVAIEAPREAISGVLERHPEVKALFDNGWLSLHAMDEAGRLAWRYDAGDWRPAEPSPEALPVAA
ncbi:MAG: DUF2309 domain-containing protein [Pseudomonadota bacterium]